MRGYLSGLVGLSRTAFAARFRDLVGEPPMRYLARLRLRYRREQAAAHGVRAAPAGL